jgi:general secretion pathway protein C
MLDAVVRRTYPAILLLAIGVIAHLHASALTTLVADAYLGGLAAPARRPARKQVVYAAEEPRRADLILARNPFDSVTGPLNRPSPGRDPDVGEGAPSPSNPLVAPRCADLQAHAVTEFTDPEWSATVLANTQDPIGRTRHMGDAVGDKKIVFIGFNALKNSPSVWLASGSALCQVLLFTKASEPASVEGPPSAASPSKPPRSGVPKSIADRIKRVSATEIHVDRSAVEDILLDQTELMQSIRVVPDRQDGKVVGLRLVGVRPDSLLGTLGLQTGDRLETVNGFDVASPESALEAYARVRTADDLVVRVTRQGRPTTIVLKIR